MAKGKLQRARRRMANQTREQRRYCVHCDCEFDHSGGLSCHNTEVHRQWTHHGCATCGNVFGSEADLKIHEDRGHDGTLPAGAAALLDARAA